MRSKQTSKENQPMAAFDLKTPFEIAESWYIESDVARCLGRSANNPFAEPEVPEDVHSPEFATWLTTQYRLAMAKGIQLGRGDVAHLIAGKLLAGCVCKAMFAAEMKAANDEA